MLESPNARMLRRLAKQVDEFRHELPAGAAEPEERDVVREEPVDVAAQSVARPSRLVRALDGRLAVEFEQTIRAWLQDFGKALVLRKDRALRKASPRRDRPDRHAVDIAVHDVLREQAVRRREAGQDAGDPLLYLPVALRAPFRPDDVVEIAVVRGHRDANGTLLDLEGLELTTAPVAFCRHREFDDLVGVLFACAAPPVPVVSRLRAALAGDLRLGRVRAEELLRRRVSFPKGRSRAVRTSLWSSRSSDWAFFLQ